MLGGRLRRWPNVPFKSKSWWKFSHLIKALSVAQGTLAFYVVWKQAGASVSFSRKCPPVDSHHHWQQWGWIRYLHVLEPSPSDYYTEIEYTSYPPSHAERIHSQGQWPGQEGNPPQQEHCPQGKGSRSLDLQHLLQWIRKVAPLHLDRPGWKRAWVCEPEQGTAGLWSETWSPEWEWGSRLKSRQLQISHGSEHRTRSSLH